MVKCRLLHYANEYLDIFPFPRLRQTMTPNPVHHKLDRNLTKDEFGGLVHHLREREAKMRRRDRVSHFLRNLAIWEGLKEIEVAEAFY